MNIEFWIILSEREKVLWSDRYCLSKLGIFSSRQMRIYYNSILKLVFFFTSVEYGRFEYIMYNNEMTAFPWSRRVRCISINCVNQHSCFYPQRMRHMLIGITPMAKLWWGGYTEQSVYVSTEEKYNYTKNFSMEFFAFGGTIWQRWTATNQLWKSARRMNFWIWPTNERQTGKRRTKKKSRHTPKKKTRHFVT